MCLQELEKAGLLNKTKIAEGGRKLRWDIKRLMLTYELDCICLYEKCLNKLRQVWLGVLHPQWQVCMYALCFAGRIGARPGWCWLGTVWFSSKIPNHRHLPAGWELRQSVFLMAEVQWWSGNHNMRKIFFITKSSANSSESFCKSSVSVPLQSSL